MEPTDMVRASDPVTAHKAAHRVKRERDRKIAWGLWRDFIEDQKWYPSRNNFYDYLFSEALVSSYPNPTKRKQRAESLRRRLSDLVARPGNPEVLWLLCATGEEDEGSQILTYTERGKAALVDPSVMEGHWGIKIPKKKKGVKVKLTIPRSKPRSKPKAAGGVAVELIILEL